MHIIHMHIFGSKLWLTNNAFLYSTLENQFLYETFYVNDIKSIIVGHSSPFILQVAVFFYTQKLQKMKKEEKDDGK